MFDDVWWMRAAKSRHVCHMSSLWTKSFVLPGFYLCFTLEIREIPRNQGFCLHLPSVSAIHFFPPGPSGFSYCAAGRAVVEFWHRFDRFTALAKRWPQPKGRLHHSNRTENDRVFAVSSSISIQQWSKIRWIGYGWYGWIVVRFEIWTWEFMRIWEWNYCILIASFLRFYGRNPVTPQLRPTAIGRGRVFVQKKLRPVFRSGPMSRTQLKLGSIESWDMLGRMEITERLENWVVNGWEMAVTCWRKLLPCQNLADLSQVEEPHFETSKAWEHSMVQEVQLVQFRALSL